MLEVFDSDWEAAVQEARASLEAAVPGLLQKTDARRPSYMLGIITHN